MLKSLLFLLVISMTHNVSAEIYKWVDAQGKVHYGDKPIENAEKMDVNISKQGHIKTNASREWKRKKLLESYADDRQRESKESEKKQKKRKQQKKYCIEFKDKMRVYNRARSLYDLDKQGNRVTLSDAQRHKATASLRNKIKKYCK